MTTETQGTEEDGTDAKLEAYRADFRRLLLDRIHDQQTSFDKAVLLVAGGAFSISAAFVPDLREPLRLPWVLAFAWLSWALCLFTAMGAYMVAIRAHEWSLEKLDAGETKEEAYKGGPNK